MLKTQSPGNKTPVQLKVERLKGKATEINMVEGKIHELNDQIQLYKTQINIQRKKLQDERDSIYNRSQMIEYRKISPDSNYQEQILSETKREVADLTSKLKYYKNKTRLLQKQLDPINNLSSTSKFSKKSINSSSLLSGSFNLETEITFAESISQPLAHQLRELNNSQHELEISQSNLRFKLEEIDDRQVLARSVISEPIDDLRSDALLTEEAETALRITQSRYESTTPKKAPFNLELLSEDIDKMIENNKRRRNILMEEKKKVQNLKARTPSSPPQFTHQFTRTQIRTHKHNNEKALKYVDTVYSKLVSRNDAYETETEKLEQLEKQIAQERIDIERDWEEKIASIESMTLELRENENLIIEIHRNSEINANIEADLSNLQAKSSKLKRRIQNLIRDQEYTANLSQSVIGTRSHLEQQQKELKQQALKIEKRRSKLKNEIKLYHKQKEVMKSLKQRVELLEAQTKSLEQSNSHILKQIQKESMEISISLANFEESTRSKRHVSSIESELRESVLIDDNNSDDFLELLD